MSHMPPSRPNLGNPHRSQGSNLASDGLVELENVAGRLLWPPTYPGRAIVASNATDDQGARSSSIVFEFGNDSPPKNNVPLAKVGQPPGKRALVYSIVGAADVFYHLEISIGQTR
ncbi:hypothetical protein DFH28DRAFT_926557 [Melampsora americana]|nr:hypothetical protein DFH28DRAFT_926557 [Melampsora americana]